MSENKFRVFNQELLRQATYKPSFIDMVRLLFRPTNYSHDGECTIWFKELDGKIIITKIKYQVNP